MHDFLLAAQALSVISLGSFGHFCSPRAGIMLRPIFRSNLMKFVKIALAITTLLPLASYAVLGGAPGADSSTPKGVRSMLQNTTAYSVHTSVDADGVTMREYTLPSNVVFAVTWQGPVRPDMSVLLGSYFQRFVSAGEARPHGTGPMIERSGDLVIQSAGRPGNLFGKAYVPRLVPAGVSVDDLQ
jgi:hypothetical protein